MTKIEDVADGALIVHRLSEDGYQRMRVQLPALIGISSEINEPRRPSLQRHYGLGACAYSGVESGRHRLPARAAKVELRRLWVPLRRPRRIDRR